MLATPRRAVASATAALLVLGLGACGGGGDQKDESAKDQPVLTDKSAAQMWASYDERNIPVLKVSGPPTYDGAAFRVADVGPVLLGDVYSSRLDRANKGKTSRPFEHVSKHVYAPVPADVDHVIAAYVTSWVGEEPDPKAPLQLASLVRTGPEEDWMMEIAPDVIAKDIPEPAAPGRASTPSKDDVERARATALSVARYASVLQVPTDVALGPAKNLPFIGTLKAKRKGTMGAEGGIHVDGPYTTPGAGQALRVVRVKGGLLAMAAFRLTEDWRVSAPDMQITRSGDLGKVIGTGPVKRSRVRWVVSMALSIPDEGKAAVIGAEGSPILEP